MVRRRRRDVRPGRDHPGRHPLSAAAVPWLVGLYITAAYWFTASTSFANPAVAIARSLTNTFAGIRPIDLPGFIAAELCGALRRHAVDGWLLRTPPGPRPVRKRRQYMTVTIYHNPDCGTSRNTLAMIRQSGEEPDIIEYLKTPPTRATLHRTDRRDGHPGARAAAREGHALQGDSASTTPNGATMSCSDFMMAHPILINRPIVVTPKGVATMPAVGSRPRSPAEVPISAGSSRRMARSSKPGRIASEAPPSADARISFQQQGGSRLRQSTAAAPERR